MTKIGSELVWDWNCSEDALNCDGVQMDKYQEHCLNNVKACYHQAQVYKQLEFDALSCREDGLVAKYNKQYNDAIEEMRLWQFRANNGPENK